MSILYTHIFPIFYISRNTLLKICGCMTIVVVMLLPCALYLDLDVAGKFRHNDNNEMKTILYWTRMFGDKHFYFGEGRVFKKCPVSSCYATHERDFMDIEDFDAIIFHGPEINASDLPAKRSPKQKYIFVDMESPMSKRLDDVFIPDGFYNWTMTYRLDSDIPRTYGTIVGKLTNDIVYPVALRRSENVIDAVTAEFAGPANSEQYKGKHRTAAWFVSHCRTDSRRELYVGELQKHIDVDVYGRCGPRRCMPRERCYRMLESRYYFYLSFENSLCEDYVTEKLYNIMRRNVIPVVYGGVNYTNFAPPHSYINVADFESPKRLADYLHYLMNNTAEYERYFWWKRHYEVGNSRTLCKMCEMLHRENFTYGSHVRLKDWFTNGTCRQPGEIIEKIM